MALSSTMGATRKRVHAIVLTRDRPATLGRCVATALRSLNADDILTVLDDSPQEAARANMREVGSPTDSLAARYHIEWSRADRALGGLTLADSTSWRTKMHRRDIAPLRNLSLILSAVVPAETTVLIDDDIDHFDLSATHHEVDRLGQNTENVILGAHIAGVSELDTVTRLSGALDRLSAMDGGDGIHSAHELFQEGAPLAGDDGRCPHVSAGYLAFRLRSDRLSAFPPGYNEDWLWCLLQGQGREVWITRTGASVRHNPPCVRKPSRDDCLFELKGDLVLDCLEQHPPAAIEDPLAFLMELREHVPTPDLLPVVRVQELADRCRSGGLSQRYQTMLDDHGLRVLLDLLRTGELAMDGSQVLSEWCSASMQTRRSFDASMRNNDAQRAITALWREGSI